MQNSPKSRLPKWLLLIIVGMFVGHYTLVLVNHFSKDLLPKKYYYLTNLYLAPWFYQNLTAFAPEPPFRRHVFVYRLKSKENWSRWKQPARQHLERQWSNRFSISVKIHDQLETLAEQMYMSAAGTSDRKRYLPYSKHRYVIDAANKYAKYYDRCYSSSSKFQTAVYVREYSVVNDSIFFADTAYLFESVPL